MASQGPLPQEIWWLVCQELTDQQEFDSLFHFALVSQNMAYIALPLLYSIHELASASADDASAVGKAKLAALWRTIILSSVDKTFYPYCLWIKNLKLGNLRELLTDIAPYPHLRDTFFKDNMESFNLVADPTKLTRQNRPRLDIQGIINKVGETITSFVKDAADRENKIVALSHLEGQYIPMDLLPIWVSRLSTLTSLTIQDGSVMGPQVAAAIRDSCPKFLALECYYCDGPTVDEDLASFFNTLPPNSLQAFSVMSQNRLGKEAFAALGRHSSSLKKLRLSNLQSPAFGHLNSLSGCTALESLILEASSMINLNWETEYKSSFLEVISWLKECTVLTHLEILHVPNATKLLGEVLKGPAVRLKALDLKLPDDNEHFYSSLANQTSLETLAMRSADESLDLPTTQHAQFVRSVCKCKALKELDLIETILTPDDLTDLSRSLENLEEFSFDGEYLTDDIWEQILEMRHLRMLNIYAISIFTFDGILDFINRLSISEPARAGFSLSIMRQDGHSKFSPDEEEILSERMISAVGGRFEILYYRDPDEEHESDFSD